MARVITEAEIASAQELFARARAAMAAIDHYDQATVDRLCRAVAWATANEQTFGRLTRMSVDESGMGSADGVPARRWKILGILRDALRTKSVGVIEELPEKGIVKYAKPAGVIAGLRAQSGDSVQAARIGVLVHSLAGDSAAQGGQRGLLASDVIAELRGWVNP